MIERWLILLICKEIPCAGTQCRDGLAHGYYDQYLVDDKCEITKSMNNMHLWTLTSQNGTNSILIIEISSPDEKGHCTPRR